MRPYAYMKWSLIPLGFMALSALTVMIGIWYFVGLVVAIRTAWVFLAPRIVPLEYARIHNSPEPRD